MHHRESVVSAPLHSAAHPLLLKFRFGLVVLLCSFMSACSVAESDADGGSLTASDAGTSNVPNRDGGAPDAGRPDSGVTDAGLADGGAPDAGHPDAGLGADGGIEADFYVLQTATARFGGVQLDDDYLVTVTALDGGLALRRACGAPDGGCCLNSIAFDFPILPGSLPPSLNAGPVTWYDSSGDVTGKWSYGRYPDVYGFSSSGSNVDAALAGTTLIPPIMGGGSIPSRAIPQSSATLDRTGFDVTWAVPVGGASRRVEVSVGMFDGYNPYRTVTCVVPDTGSLHFDSKLLKQLPPTDGGTYGELLLTRWSESSWESTSGVVIRGHGQTQSISQAVQLK